MPLTESLSGLINKLRELTPSYLKTELLGNSKENSPNGSQT